MCGGGLWAPAAAYAMGDETMEEVKLLCVFRMRYIDFRLAEMEALARTATGLETLPPDHADQDPSTSPPPTGGRECFRWEYPRGGRGAMDGLFWYLIAPSRPAAEALARIVEERGVLAKVLVELWSEGDSFEDLLASLGGANAGRVEEQKKRLPCFQTKDSTFKFVCDGFGRKIGLNEQLERIGAVATLLGYKGKVRLKCPDYHFYIGHATSDYEINVPEMRNTWYFGQLLARTSTYYERYRLSDRAYLGPTSMDHEMAAVMANMGQVSRNSLVFDPYVGTGSILVACSHLGAMTFGGDIDVKVILWGKDSASGGGKKVNLWSNFDSYGLRRPLGILRCDAHALPFRNETEEVFDAVVCDPPYGIRAGGRKSGGKKAGMKEVPKDLKDSHIPSTGTYTMSECLVDLLDFSAKLLKQGGRLVYFFPSSNGIVLKEYLPGHPCLRVDHCSEQELTKLWGRKLVTMVKCKAWDEEEARVHKAKMLAMGSDLLKFDRLQDIVFDIVDNGGSDQDRAALRESKDNMTRRNYKGKKV